MNAKNIKAIYTNLYPYLRFPKFVVSWIYPNIGGIKVTPKF